MAQALQDVWLDHAVTRAEPLLGQKYAGIGQQLSIMCGESPNPPASTFAWQSSFATDRSGTTGPYWSWIPSGCASWPATAALRYVGPWNKRTAKPILVMSTTFDPATPYQGAQFMTKTLARARLLTVDGYGHTALFNTSTCANDYSSRYFIEGRLPRVGTRCAQDFVPFASGS
ncbi:MAG: alpha/beta hydrolase [Actinomycetes bacterium]